MGRCGAETQRSPLGRQRQEDREGGVSEAAQCEGRLWLSSWAASTASVSSTTKTNSSLKPAPAAITCWQVKVAHKVGVHELFPTFFTDGVIKLHDGPCKRKGSLYSFRDSHNSLLSVLLTYCHRSYACHKSGSLWETIF